MVNPGIEQFWGRLFLRKELCDSSLGAEETGFVQQAIQPYGTPRHSFQTNPEQAGSFGFDARGIFPPPRILFR